MHDGLRAAAMKNLEALGLDDGARGFKGLTHGVLVWQMLVGDEPEVAGGAQTSGGGGDEFQTEHGVGITTVMEGRVHDDDIVAGFTESGGDV